MNTEQAQDADGHLNLNRLTGNSVKLYDEDIFCSINIYVVILDTYVQTRYPVCIIDTAMNHDGRLLHL